MKVSWRRIFTISHKSVRSSKRVAVSDASDSFEFVRSEAARLRFQSSSQVAVEVDHTAGHGRIHRRLRQHSPQVRLDVSGQ